MSTNNLQCVSCIDGRATNEIMAAPGGDAGNLFRALLSCYRVTNSSIFTDESKIKEIIYQTAKTIGHQLYFHTDDHAMHHYDPLTSQPNEAHVSDHIGCGYFKVCITAPEKLKEDAVCPDIAQKFLRALVSTIQEHKELFDIIILQGGHKEKRVILSHSTKPIKADGETFIYHPNVESTEGGKFLDVIFSLHSELLPKKAEITEYYNNLCKQHWEGTINVLLPGGKIEVQD